MPEFHPAMSDDPFVTDPFTQTINRLWYALENHAGFTSRVRVGNRIKLTTGAAMAKLGMGAKQPADLAEVEIAPAPGGNAHLFRTSSGSAASRNFDIRILKSGGRTISEKLFPLQWQFLQAFAKLGPDMGLPMFVADWFLSDSFNDEPLPSGNDGWSDFMRATVNYKFTTASLLRGSL